MTAEKALREALTDANETIAMMRNHLAQDHPDCSYAVLGILNYASRVALAAQPAASPDYMCPNCVTPWKCNWPHFLEGEEPRPQNRPPPDDAVGA